MYTIPPITVTANTTNPIHPLRLSWRMSQIKNATNGSTKIIQKISEGADMAMSGLMSE
jgi:hypothetical protein